MAKKILLVLAAVVAVLVFQNCGSSGFDSAAGETEQSLEADPKLAAAPFPFESNLNIISYMSCPTAAKFQNTGGPYFTFRVGGFDGTASKAINKLYRDAGMPVIDDMAEGGLTLRSEFLDYVDKNYKTTKIQASTEAIQNVLTSHPEFKEAQAQVSFRSKSDLLTLISYPESSNAVSVNVLGKLSDSAYTYPLASNRGIFVNSFPAQAENKKQFSASIFLTGAGENQNLIRSDIQQNYYLTVDFAKKSEDGMLKFSMPFQPAANDGSRIYGRGYAINFAKPNSIPVTAAAALNPNMAVDTYGISEYDLSSISGAGHLQSDARWSCLSYAIVRRQDARDRADGRSRCPIEPYSAIRRDRLDIVRKILPADEWEVNTQLGCVVPTVKTEQQGSCYLTTTANPADEPMPFMNSLTGTGTDYENPTLGGGFPSGIEYRYFTRGCGAANGGRRECVNFITFCYRAK